VEYPDWRFLAVKNLVLAVLNWIIVYNNLNKNLDERRFTCSFGNTYPGWFSWNGLATGERNKIMIRKLFGDNYIGLLIIPVLILGLAVTIVPTRAQTITPEHSGYGTATIDGQLSSGEWDNAASINFQANTPEGTTTPATLYIMNDDDNLYLAVSMERPSLDSYTHLRYLFDNDNDNTGENGDDYLIVYRDWRPSQFSDLFRSDGQTFYDTDYEGSNDGTGAVDHTGGFTVLEISHPLNSEDDDHDFSLKGLDTVGLTFTLYISNSSGNASTRLPDYPQKFLSIEISGESVIVPNGLATSEGNYANGYPFHLIWANKQSMRYQQVYEASEFPFTNSPYLITKIAFRPDAIHGVPFSATISDIQLNLSTTKMSPDHLSTVFVNNVGTNDKVVFSGPLLLSSEDIGPSGGPMDFDIFIPLQDPFLYNPSVGNLLLDIRSFSAALTTGFDAQEEYGDPISRVFTTGQDGVNQSSGSWHTGALVTQFSMFSVADLIPLADPNGPYIATIGTSISFDGNGSSGPNGNGITYSWDFGDGSTGTGANPSKAFGQAGLFDVCLSVNDGNLESDQVCTQAIVYDPSGGFVTGGGWIWSFPDTYVPEPNVAGWANFGFVARYHKGAEVPDGQAELVYHTAGMNFHSTEYDWLVVTGGDKAKFKGRGTINGEGDYKFMIWAGDGDPDTFRIKIWEESGGAELVIYDNSLANSTFENGQPIGKGSIVIHAPKKTPTEVLDQYQTGINYGFWFDNEMLRWQEFIPTGDNLSAVEVYLKKNGNPGNVYAEIRNSENVILGQEMVSGENILGSGWVRFDFSNQISLTPGMKYKLYIFGDQDTLSADDSYFWRGNPASTYCTECDNDVKSGWPDYAYAFRTYSIMY